MRDRKKFLLAKEELTEGVDPGLVAADAIKTAGISITPYGGNQVELAYDKAVFGANPVINVNPQVEIMAPVMFASSGTAGVAPQWGELMKAAGFSETIQATPDQVVYANISTVSTSMTCYFIYPQDAGVNDQVHETNGCRNDMSFTLQAGQFPRFDFRVLGSYTTPVAAGSVTPDFTGWIDPIAVTASNTPTVTINGASSCLQSITHNMNTVLTRQNIPGCEKTIIEAQPGGGTFVIRAPDVDTTDFFTDIIENHNGVTQFATQIIHGSTAGQIMQIDYTAMEISGLTHTVVNGELFYSMNFVDVDNSLVITAK